MRSLPKRTSLLPRIASYSFGLMVACSSGGGPLPEGDQGAGGDDNLPPTTTPVAPFVPAPVPPPVQQRPVTPTPGNGTTPVTTPGGIAGYPGTTLTDPVPVRPPPPTGNGGTSSIGQGASGAPSTGAPTVPTDYASARGVTGCCQGDKDLYSYDISAGSVAHIACATSCGWSAGFYKCGGQGQDASGQNPRACNVPGNVVTPPTPTPPSGGSLSCNGDVPAFVGCCAGTTYYVCQNATTSAPTADDCAKKTGKDGQKQKCGWSPATSGTPTGFYGCVDQSASDTDPSCDYVRVCKTPKTACTKTNPLQQRAREPDDFCGRLP